MKGIGNTFVRTVRKNKTARCGRFRTCEYCAYSAFFNDLAVVENCNMSAYLFNNAHLMCYYDYGYAEAPIYLAYKTEYRVRGIWVESACCLIAQKHFRIGRERTRAMATRCC